VSATSNELADAEQDAAKNRLFRNFFCISVHNFSTTVRKRFEEFMLSHGASKVPRSSMNNLRRNLEKELAESIHICPDDNGKLLLYADNLSKSELVKRTYALKTELDAMRAESVELVAKAALLLRNDIKQNETNQLWPPDVEQDREACLSSTT